MKFQYYSPAFSQAGPSINHSLPFSKRYHKQSIGCLWVQNTSDFSLLLFMAISFRFFCEVDSSLDEIPYKIVSLGVLHFLFVGFFKKPPPPKKKNKNKNKLNCSKEKQPLVWTIAHKPPLQTAEVTVLLWHIYKSYIIDELRQMRTFVQQNWNPLYYGRQYCLHFRLV